MFYFIKYLLYLVAISILFGCNSVVSDSESKGGDKNWLIPKDQVYDVTGKNGIPSIDNPKFVSVSDVDYIRDDELVLGVRIGSEVRSYPHQILEYHEIVNDETPNGKSFILTYCPLTGSGICFYPDVKKNEQTTFGVSGLLYNNNLIMFDRKTDSYWSQMLLMSVTGTKIGSRLELCQTVEMKWEHWKALYPNSKVLSRDTGFSRNYGLSLYKTYKASHSMFMFPYQILEHNQGVENQYLNKERIYTLINGDFGKSFSIENFDDDISLHKIHFANSEYVVIGSKEISTISVFIPKLPDGTHLIIDSVIEEFPVVARDQFGNGWDLFGYAIEGPNKGLRLQKAEGFFAYWFAWLGFVRHILVGEKDL